MTVTCETCMKLSSCPMALPADGCHTPRPSPELLMKRHDIEEPMGSLRAAQERFERGGM